MQLATQALDATRRAEQMSAAQRYDLPQLQTTITTRLTARAWRLREELRDILNRKQLNIVAKMLRR